ncbi:MAG: dihydrodipicolinate synthase family protein [Gemmatimonadetes bacterium]|nr:dihydrodipicolinate synthase family protein [Gemmatimonadota bacterium]
MPTQPLPHGLWPVMLNAFHEDGTIDWHGVDALTDWYIERGSAGLFTCCGSSEMFHLDDVERLAVAQRVVSRTSGSVPVVATGTFGGPIEDQARFVKHMADSGVDAVVVIVCLLADGNEDEEILQRNMERLLELTDPIPLGLYECPTPYHRKLSPELFGHLGATGRFLYHKDTVCDIDLLRLKIDAVRNTPLGVYNAHFETGLEGLRYGATGISPVAGNVFPELFSWLCAEYDEQPETAEEVQRMMTSLAPVVNNKYLVTCKRYLQRIGLPITTRCRSTDARLTGFDEGLIDGLQTSVERFAEALGISRTVPA